MKRQCFLRCILDSHPPIPLPNDIETTIGRTKTTKIKDQSCSRQQISLKPDYQECTVKIKQLGINPSGLDGFAMKKGELYTVKHGARIEVLLNQYIHILEFEPPPESEVSPKYGKRKLEDDKISYQKVKTIKTEMYEQDNQNSVETLDNIWEEIDKGELYIFTSKGVKSRSKIAAFDMDGTLIKTKSGKVYPVDTNDWQLSFSVVPQKLKEIFDQGFKIVILTNQAPIGKGRVKIQDFKLKMEAIVEKLKVPMQAFIATGKSIYRKPTTGMWDYLKDKKNDCVDINTADSFYCGDAAGRLANWAPGKKKDHSMADTLLAQNLGLKFYTPEQFFLGHSIANIPVAKPEFIPHEVSSEPFNEKLISNEKEILVLVGFPGSGKSFLAKQIEKKSNYRYASVCRDLLGTWQKCAAEATKLLQAGKSVVVDSTNPDEESRSRWTALAKDMKVVCRCAKMATSKAHAQHNNKFRELMKIKHMPVNDIVFHTYKNKYKEPSQSEGFSEILEVKFNPIFEDKEAEKLYRMHLLEK